MKKIVLFQIGFLLAYFSFAQSNVGIGTNIPDASALLDISSTNKGLLIPRMKTEKRMDIGAPAKGLLVFDTDTNSFWYFNGSAWTSLAGSAPLTLPYQQSVTTGGNAFDITNLGSGGALKGVANTASGIGVYGETANGNGVKGYANNAGSIAVFGSSLAGTGVKATSFTGLALDVAGNLKISGGNTNPADGAVLTSDATGNAVWKQAKVAFEVKNSQLTPQLAANTLVTLPFQIELFDAGADFNISTAVVDPNTFIAPVAGVYAFSSAVRIGIFSASQNMESCTYQLYKNGNSIGATWSPGPTNNSTSSYVSLSINKTVHLNAGDKIKVVLYQTNGGDIAASYQDASFSGYLAFAD